MLVLSRRIGEEIVIPHLQIRLTVLQVGEHQVEFGVSAPREIGIFRKEFWDRIHGGPTTAVRDDHGPDVSNYPKAPAGAEANRDTIA